MKFISGTYFKRQCRYQIGDYSDARNYHLSYYCDPDIDNDLIFVKTELLSQFLQLKKLAPEKFPESYSLVLHNSDINFDINNIKGVFDHFTGVDKVYTQNLLVDYPNSFPLPIGIANPKWSHGNTDRFEKVINQEIPKTNMVYINFNVATNPKERNYCLQHVGSNQRHYPNYMNIDEHNSFVESTQEQYLKDIKASYFVVSPDGNGKDCHKTWESIYMGSIPIVTDSYFARRFKELGVPIYIIDDWNQFQHLHLTPKLYNVVWNNFDINNLKIGLFINECT